MYLYIYVYVQKYIFIIIYCICIYLTFVMSCIVCQFLVVPDLQIRSVLEVTCPDSFYDFDFKPRDGSSGTGRCEGVRVDKKNWPISLAALARV